MPLNPNDTLANGQTRILRLLGQGGGWQAAVLEEHGHP